MSEVAKLPKVLFGAAQFGQLDMVRNKSALVTVLAAIDEPMDAGTLSQAYRLWERSGLRESVRSNADMNYMSTTGLGITGDVLRKMDNLSLMFYRTAELYNRRISFIVAYNNTINRLGTKVAKMTDDDLLSEILVDANRFMLELNTANKAWWQGGRGANGVQKTLSLSTQFMQVLTKTGEAVLKGQKRGGFSTSDKGRIAMGQALFFGAAGVPILNMFGGALVGGLASWMGLDSEDPKDVQAIEHMATVFNQGLVGLVGNVATGADIELSSRAGLGIGTLQLVKDIVTSQDPMWIKLLGLTGETGRRVGDAATQMQGMASSMFMHELSKLEPLAFGDRSDIQLTADNYLSAAKDIGLILADIPSSGRNFFKMRMMRHSDKILDRRGRVRIEDDFNWQTELAVGLGFRTTPEARLQAVLDDEKYHQEIVQDASNILVNAYHRYVYKHRMNDAYAENLTLLVASVHQTLDNDYLVEQLTRSLESRIFNNPQTIEEKALQEFYNRTAPDMVTQGMILDSQNLINLGATFSPTPVVVPFAGTIKGDK
jgi:hypothetical protein